MREPGSETPTSNGGEERIFVSIRVRPLNEKEKARYDVSEWECVSANTIRFKNSGLAEQRSISMDGYTFGKKMFYMLLPIIYTIPINQYHKSHLFPDPLS